MKKIIILFACSIITFSLHAQLVNIPDTNFKNYLVNNAGINTNGDNEIQLSEAINFNGTISCGNQGINDLTGIEAFENLRYLYCQTNNLNFLDVSANTALIFLSCGENNLSTLDVTNNVNLLRLFCNSNDLTLLDISTNISLRQIRCHNNAIIELDVSVNIALEELYCHANELCTLDVSNNINLDLLSCRTNQLTSLNVANNLNENIDVFKAQNNPNLTCIQIDDGFVPPMSWEKDAQASYDVSCCYIDVCVSGEACVTLKDALDCPIEDLKIQYPIESTGCSEQQYITAQTNSEGAFCIPIAEGECARLEIQNCEDLCDYPINIRDLLILHKYLLGFTDTVSAYPFAPIFGDVTDVNTTNIVTAADLLEIRKYLLGLPTSDDRIGKCILFDTDKVTVDGPYWNGSLDSVICDGDDLNLMAGVMGDVNSSCSPCYMEVAPPTTTSTTLKTRHDGTTQLFSFKDDISFHELFLEFQLDHNVSPHEVAFQNTGVTYLKQVEGNTVKISMYSENGIPAIIRANEDFLSISSGLNSAVILTDRTSILVTNDWELSDIELSEDRAKHSKLDQSSTVLFGTEETLNVKVLSELDEVTIRVFDFSGNELERTFHSNLKADSVVTYNSSTYTGIYFVSVQAKQTKETHKIAF